MKYETIRKEVLEAARQAQAGGLIRGTSGNFACRDEKDPVFAITPSALPYETMTAEDIAVVSLETGEQVAGPHRPSSETPMHRAVFLRNDAVKATVHTHSLYATIAGMRGKLLPSTPPHALLVPVAVLPYCLPGDPDGAKRAAEAFADGAGSVLLQNHGLICKGSSMEKAMEAAFYLEEMAKIQYLAETAGCFAPLDEKEIEDLKAFFARTGAV